MILYKYEGKHKHDRYFCIYDNGLICKVKGYISKFLSINSVYERINNPSSQKTEFVEPRQDKHNELLVKLAEFDNIEDLKDLFPEEFI